MTSELEQKDDAPVEANSIDEARRLMLIKYAKWSSPAMITLLLTDKASAASQPRPPPPTGF